MRSIYIYDISSLRVKS